MEVVFSHLRTAGHCYPHFRYVNAGKCKHCKSLLWIVFILKFSAWFGAHQNPGLIAAVANTQAVNGCVSLFKWPWAQFVVASALCSYAHQWKVGVKCNHSDLAEFYLYLAQVLMIAQGPGNDELGPLSHCLKLSAHSHSCHLALGK